MSNNSLVKSKMSDDERLALAEKLDRDLDEFIDGLERKRYTDGWPEDRWEEEMDKHPFFMKKPPEEGEELHPLLEGIQQLKYDPMENTEEDLAATYKEDGNFYVKHKKYRMAIYSYTEGLNRNFNNDELKSALYNNRSAAHFFIKNYRSSIGDANKALAINPKYLKAHLRIAQCHNLLGKHDDCMRVCDEILHSDPTHQAAIELRKASQLSKANLSRDQRKLNAMSKKKEDALNRTLMELNKRNIQFEDRKLNSPITETLIQPKLAPLEDFPVSLDENGLLVWPISFCYPEFLFSDFQQQVCEDVTMIEALRHLFSEPLECDTQRKYRPDSCNVYYENRIAGSVHKINLSATIKSIVSEKRFLVSGGCLIFYVVPKDSATETEYVHKERNPLVKTF
ncbi:DNA polymerase interacting tetratricopeptide repeat-containing, protein of 47 kDa [Pseudolycoriella hygida]|uniref:DNA polymerase interacting tetratricopeptide repeat-containing, protein of 47 kDa n=1 Tax=Pseudolycoriella hygida TaxID=35572 RepID=A0A9Q0S0R2_9DIPT|nr:DNA polymerase interacting tetratricopeptide repeat-containing, protein of 47 kDa [Pseudolycoriella hygida]